MPTAVSRVDYVYQTHFATGSYSFKQIQTTAGYHLEGLQNADKKQKKTKLRLSVGEACGHTKDYPKKIIGRRCKQHKPLKKKKKKGYHVVFEVAVSVEDFVHSVNWPTSKPVWPHTWRLRWLFQLKVLFTQWTDLPANLYDPTRGVWGGCFSWRFCSLS